MSRPGRDVVAVLHDFASWNELAGGKVTRVTVEVTERYLRRRLRLRKHEPTAYRGLTTLCIGSKAWREKRAWQRTQQVA